MTQRIFTYAGEEPTINRQQINQDRVLDLLERQLRVIEQLTAQIILIPKGTQISQHTGDKIV